MRDAVLPGLGAEADGSAFVPLRFTELAAVHLSVAVTCVKDLG